MTFSTAPIVGGVAILLFWLLYFECWRHYRTDRLRQVLFECRHQLFLLAASGEVSFEAKAYCMLRMRINAMIRYAHDASFFRIATIDAIEKVSPLVPMEEMQKEWGDAVKMLPTEVSEKIVELHNGAVTDVALHIALFPAIAMMPLILWVLAVIKVASVIKPLVRRQAASFEVSAVQEYVVEVDAGRRSLISVTS